ncbi:hypothetical protein NLU13_5603 [Sarocladium strictum]|uniref:Uncharacterized protein n=1 Tax=Sarocladium strictum TaxID=5046 RepID=A0AA39L7Y5_SARSR|nr:hypothetical protein NLU13_5603 [Sarocladium strictum]
METPGIPPPHDEREQAILDQFILIRDQLLLLKQDRTTYIRSQDVIPLYDQMIEQVSQLNAIRADAGVKEETRVDRVMDSCFQLLSLFYLTIGRNNEAPAAYSLTSTIKRLLDHLIEADLYSAKDLGSIGATLERLSHSVKQATSGTDGNQHSPVVITLIANRVALCQTLLDKLQERLKRLGQPLLETYEKLVSILRCIALANTRSKFSASEVQKFKNQLRDIGEKRIDGKFCAPDGSVPPGGEEVCDLYQRVMPEPFRPTYATLISIRNDLEKLSLTQAWSLRETDLYDFQRKLDKIDESRGPDGNFYDEKGRPADLWVQRTMLYLIRRSYAYIYSFMISSEPVSEALLPIYNQLQTLKRCLVEVKKSGGVSSVRELYPYSMKLNSLDNMRVDGKFIVNGDIPEGQGSVSELLAECFDLNYELRVSAEEGDVANGD